jgi:hypothetical protein
VYAAPLLEEKWDFDSYTLIPNIRDPSLRLKKVSADAWLEQKRLCAYNKLELTNCGAKQKLIYNFLIISQIGWI